MSSKDDTVICPVCHYPRDRKAMYCRWCNDSSWGKYDSETEKMNKEYQKTISDDNLAYRKYKAYSPKRNKKRRQKDDYNDLDYQTDYSTNQPSDVTVENIGVGIGLAVATGLILYNVGKRIYEKRKVRESNTKSIKKKSLREKLFKKKSSNNY